ncbi:MAG TPA: outer membrane lipoprotein-sorting protein [Flavisolibacter sp.]|nr:outer membrane lipoprotein-sorting protein [Flavisolibacter sp.]
MIASDLLKTEDITIINARQIGATCFREVTMTIGKLGQSVLNPSRKLTIRTVRNTEDNDSMTLFCACDPIMFRGITFLMHEKKGRLSPLDIHLFIPYGLALVRKVDEDRRGEGLLGSDFGYEDLRTWQNLEGLNWELKNFDVGTFYVYEAEWVAGQTPSSIEWHRQRVWISKTDLTIIKVEYFKNYGTEAFRVLMIPEYKFVDGILIPARMQMQNFHSAHETTISLVHAWHGRPVDRDMFQPQKLKEARKYLGELRSQG